jgi:uroporphyrinogen-III synthase
MGCEPSVPDVAGITTEETADRLRDALSAWDLTLDPLVPVALEATRGPELIAASQRLGDYDAVVVGSVHAVEGLDALEGPVSQALCITVGPRTTEAVDRSRRLRGSVVESSVRRAEGMFHTLKVHLQLAGSKLLVPRTATGRAWLVEALTEAGAEVDAPEAYRSVPTPVPDALRRLGRAKAVALGSGALLDALVDQRPELMPVLAERRLAVMGPVAADHARARGLTVSAVADPPSVRRLAEVIHALVERDA